MKTTQPNHPLQAECARAANDWDKLLTPKTTHTPGPWAANISELEASSSLVSVRTENGGYLICSDAGYQNAPLIAAAPDLLAALIDMLYGKRDQVKALAAIAKAEGRKP